MAGFIVWSIAALIFAAIGVSAGKAGTAVGFFTFAKPPAVKEVGRYNHAVSVLWFASAVILELLGIPVLFLEQNSAAFIFLVLGVIILVIGMMLAYLKIERKYRE